MRVGQVEVDADFEFGATADAGEVVGHLGPRVLEDARAAGVAAERAEPGNDDLRVVDIRLLVAIVGGDLRPQFVHHGRSHQRLPRTLETVARVLARVVRRFRRALLRRVEIEVGAVQVAEGVLQVQALVGRDLVVDAAEQGGRVVGAVLLTFQGAQAGRHNHAGGLILELHHERHTQVVLLERDEVEGLVGPQGAASRTAELILLVVQLLIERVSGGQLAIAVVVEGITARVVGARLGDDVDEAGRGAADVGAGARAHDLELVDRRLREEEHRLVAAALIALQRVVEVGAIDGDVRVDRALARDHHARPIRFLHQRRRQLRELRERAAANRQVINGLQRDVRAGGLRRGVEEHRARRDRHRFRHGADRQLQRQGRHFADAELNARQGKRREARDRGLHRVGADGHRPETEPAVGVGHDRAEVTRGGIADRDGRAGNRRIGGIHEGAGNRRGATFLSRQRQRR